MVYRKTAVFCVVLVGLILFSPPRILSGVNFEPSLRSDVIAVGFNAIVTGTAGPGSRIAVTVTGPASVPATNGTTGADGRITIPVGPFQVKGTYGLTVQSGSDRKSLVLEVEDQVADGAVAQGAEQFNQANSEVMAALENSLNVVEQQINLFPPNDRGIPQVRQGISRLRGHYQDMAVIITTIIQGNTEFASIAGRPTFRYSWQDMARFYKERGEGLRQGVHQLDEVSDPAEFQSQSDWCARALQAKAVFFVANTIVERLRGGLKEFLEEKFAGFLAGLTADAGLQLLNAQNPTGRGTPLQEQIAINLAQSAGEVIYARLTKAVAYIKWDLILEAMDFIVNTGLDIYMSYKCLTFTGRMKGHVHLEALQEKRVPYWAQDNDWEGDVTLTCAKPESSAPVPVWGIIYGKGKNFVGTNMLAVLFPKTLAFAQFLTTQPSKLYQALAYFCMRLEGTVAGSTITLKLGSPWVDMYNGLTSQFASIVVPTNSPIPIVKTYKIPFQNAGWQLSRTLSREGARHTIAMEYIGLQEGRRRVKDQKSRELKAEGARGVFTWKIDLCAGCPSEWKPDF
jgi:hypothetical protein